MNDKSKIQLKRTITLPMLVFYGLGNIFGAGIYVLIGEIAGISGIYMPLSFLIACIVIFFTALSYSELSSRYPVSAGEAIYINEGFKSPLLSTIVGLTIALSGLFSSAAILLGFHGYLGTFFGMSEFTTLLMLVTLLSGIAIWGISESITVTVVLTVIEIFGLCMIIYVGAEHVTLDSHLLNTITPDMELSTINPIILGAFLAFYAFIGFEDMINVAEEVNNPTQTIPRAIMITLMIATLFYIAVAIVAISVVPFDELSKSTAPLAKVYETATQSDANILSIIAMFAVLNGALIQIIMVSRILYGMSKQKWIPSFLAIVHPKTKTPIYATIITALLILILGSTLPLLSLAQYTSFLIFIVFILVNLSLIIIKLRDPNPQDVKSYSVVFPIIAILLNITLLVFQIMS